MSWDQRRRTPADYLQPHKAARILAAHAGICHLCGHPGATSVDHIIPWSQWDHPGLSVHDKSNLAPAHATPCPTCGRDCHADKTKTEAAAGRAKAAAARQAAGRRPVQPHPGAITHSDG